MLILLVSTYWLFMAISFGFFSKLLYTLNPNAALIIIGFFLLAKVTKAIAKVNVTRIVAEKQALLIKEWEAKKTPEPTFPTEVKKDVL